MPGGVSYPALRTLQRTREESAAHAIGPRVALAFVEKQHSERARLLFVDNGRLRASICCLALVGKERSQVDLGLVAGSPVCPRAPVDERIGDGVVAGGPLTHPGSGESPLSAGSRRPGRVLSQAYVGGGTTKPSGGRGSSCVSAKVRASCVAGRQSITSASIRCAKARAAGAGWPGKGCPSCLCGPVNVRACRPGTARVQSRPIGRRTAFRASEARRSGSCRESGRGSHLDSVLAARSARS